MNSIFARHIGLLFLLVVCGAICSFGANNFTDNPNPLAALSKKQKAHFDAYNRFNSLKASGKDFDVNAVYSELFRPVVEWCNSAGPKYKYESQKAGDKALATQNERIKKELQAKSAIYADMFYVCSDIVSLFNKKHFYPIFDKMSKLVALEADCQAKNYQYLKHEFLTNTEFQTLFVRYNAYISKSNNSSQKNRNKKDNSAKHNSETRTQTNPTENLDHRKTRQRN